MPKLYRPILLRNLNYLVAFVHVAQARSFSGAAPRLSLTQPALSRQVKELERAVGARLFDRTRYGVAPTEAGYALLRLAEKVLESVQELETAVLGMAGDLGGLLRIGGSTVWEYLLPGLLGGFQIAHPRVTVDLVIGNSRQVMGLLLEDEVHLAFIGEDPVDKRLEAIFVVGDELVIIAPPGHELASGGPVPPSGWRKCRLCIGRLIRRPRRSPPRTWRECGARPHAVMELGSHEAIKAAVRAGLGLGMISRCAVQQELASGTLTQVVLNIAPCIRPLYAVRNRTRPLSPVQRAFIGHAVEAHAGSPGEPPDPQPA